MLADAAAASSSERSRWGVDDLLGEWRERDALRGRRVAWGDGEGTADGIDDEGRLVVALDDGSRRALDAGEVHLGTAQAG